MNGTPAIAARNIVNRFGKQVVHDHLNFEVEPGEVIGLVGGSGSGKSVLMQTIVGLRKPNEGEIKIFGKAQQAAEYGCQGIEIGVLFQHGALFSALTVLENVMAPMREHTSLPRAVCAELAMQKLQLTGLPLEAAHKHASELSGGMIKRASLARALALDPAILFLDEPTAGLDPIAATQFDELVQNLQQSLHLTIVIITHDLDTLFSICNRIAVLVDKNIVVGTLENLLALDHPWIYKYFHGPRARAALQQPLESHSA